MHREIINNENGLKETFPIGRGFYNNDAKPSDKKDLEIYELRDEITLTPKAGGSHIDERLTAIDSKKDVIEVGGTRYRIDAFKEDIKIIRLEGDLPYLEVRR